MSTPHPINDILKPFWSLYVEDRPFSATEIAGWMVKYSELDLGGMKSRAEHESLANAFVCLMTSVSMPKYDLGRLNLYLEELEAYLAASKDIHHRQVPRTKFPDDQMMSWIASLVCLVSLARHAEIFWDSLPRRFANYVLAGDPSLDHGQVLAKLGRFVFEAMDQPPRG